MLDSRAENVPTWPKVPEGTLVPYRCVLNTGTTNTSECQSNGAWSVPVIGCGEFQYKQKLNVLVYSAILITRVHMHPIGVYSTLVQPTHLSVKVTVHGPFLLLVVVSFRLKKYQMF